MTFKLANICNFNKSFNSNSAVKRFICKEEKKEIYVDKTDINVTEQKKN